MVTVLCSSLSLAQQELALLSPIQVISRNTGKEERRSCLGDQLVVAQRVVAQLERLAQQVLALLARPLSRRHCAPEQLPQRPACELLTISDIKHTAGFGSDTRGFCQYSWRAGTALPSSSCSALHLMLYI